MKPTALDRIILKLPPERQAAAAVAFRDLGNNPNGPLQTIYAEIFDYLDRHEKDVIGVFMLHAAATKTALTGEIATHFAEQKQANQRIIQSIHSGKMWRRILLHRLAGALLWAGIIIVGTPVVIQHQMAATLREAEKHTTIMKQIQAEQTSTLQKINASSSDLIECVQTAEKVIEMGKATANTLAAVMSFLEIPSARMAVKEGKLTVQIPTKGVVITQGSGNTILQFQQSMPQLNGINHSATDSDVDY